MKRFLIPLSDYNRIHQLAHGVLKDVANVERACIFFAAFGSYLLRKHYKIPARPVAGAFALCVSDTPDVALFGKRVGNQIQSDTDAFHMWVQTETHIIDFMAPVFPEAFAGHSGQTPIPRRMIQKPLTEEVEGPNALTRPGDFLTLPDADLTETLLNGFLRKPANEDLIRVGETWFGRRATKQKPEIEMMNDLGKVYRLRLCRHSASSAW